ncbi:hypothetical protein F4680DRAFT_161371 [Xylaria scruposa]|nr:hypothetical protein F4680DRAFT_161371 [Xylaria scruposa]
MVTFSYCHHGIGDASLLKETTRTSQDSRGKDKPNEEVDGGPQLPIPFLEKAGRRRGVVRITRPVDVADFLVGAKRCLLGTRIVAGLLIAVRPARLRRVDIHDLMRVVGVVSSGAAVMEMLMTVLMKLLLVVVLFARFHGGLRVGRCTLVWGGASALTLLFRRTHGAAKKVVSTESRRGGDETRRGRRKEEKRVAAEGAEDLSRSAARTRERDERETGAGSIIVSDLHGCQETPASQLSGRAA